MEKKTLNPKKVPFYIPERQDNHPRKILKLINSETKGKDSFQKHFVKLKTILFPVFYIFLYFATLSAYPNLLLFYFGYVILGLFIVIIFLNVIHEVCHENVFKSKPLNRLFLYFFDIVGANSYIWKQRHLLMHHNYPNVKGWDTDIEQSSMFKIYPDAQHTKFHNIQHYLLFLLYPLYLFNWLIIRDFKDFFSKNSTIKKSVDIPTIEYVKLILFKLFYFFYIFFVPTYFFKIPFLIVLGGFILHTFVTSVFALLVLLPPHANVENEFPEVNQDLKMQFTWVDHQLRTTVDISTHNWFISFFMGNFNYHVAHHLFPSIAYSDLAIATKVLKKYALENNLPYKEYSLWTALKNHYRLVKRNSINQSEIFNETF